MDRSWPPRTATSPDDLAVVVRLPDRSAPSAESLAEVHAEAVLRAAARRLEAAPPAPPSLSRRSVVVSVMAMLGILAAVLLPAVTGGDDARPSGTVVQHSRDTTGWDPWVDPFAGTPVSRP